VWVGNSFPKGVWDDTCLWSEHGNNNKENAVSPLFFFFIKWAVSSLPCRRLTELQRALKAPQAAGITRLRGHTSASSSPVCVRPQFVCSKGEEKKRTRRLNAPLCLDPSRWLFGNDASQAKHNKPLASFGVPADLTTVCARDLDRHLDRHGSCRLVGGCEAPARTRPG